MQENFVLTEAAYYILLSLLEPRHGYGIIQDVSAISKGRVNLAAGTLYGAIGSMLEKGWILALPGEQNSRRKEYKITENGRIILENEFNRLRELIRNGRRIIEDEIK